MFRPCSTWRAERSMIDERMPFLASRRFRVLRLLLLAWCWPAIAQAADAPIRFRVTLAEGMTTAPAAGRLLIFMTDKPVDGRSIGTGFIPRI